MTGRAERTGAGALACARAPRPQALKGWPARKVGATGGACRAIHRQVLEAHDLIAQTRQTRVPLGQRVRVRRHTLTNLQREVRRRGTHELRQLVVGRDSVVLFHDRHRAAW